MTTTPSSPGAPITDKRQLIEHLESGNKPPSDLYMFEHTKMPAVNPGSVPPDQLWAITAYILQKNGFTAGNLDLGDAASSRLLAQQ